MFHSFFHVEKDICPNIAIKNHTQCSLNGVVVLKLPRIHCVGCACERYIDKDTKKDEIKINKVKHVSLGVVRTEDVDFGSG